MKRTYKGDPFKLRTLSSNMEIPSHFTDRTRVPHYRWDFRCEMPSGYSFPKVWANSVANKLSTFCGKYAFNLFAYHLPLPSPGPKYYKYSKSKKASFRSPFFQHHQVSGYFETFSPQTSKYLNTLLKFEYLAPASKNASQSWVSVQRAHKELDSWLSGPYTQGPHPLQELMEGTPPLKSPYFSKKLAPFPSSYSSVPRYVKVRQKTARSLMAEFDSVTSPDQFTRMSDSGYFY